MSSSHRSSKRDGYRDEGSRRSSRYADRDEHRSSERYSRRYDRSRSSSCERRDEGRRSEHSSGHYDRRYRKEEHERPEPVRRKIEEPYEPAPRPVDEGKRGLGVEIHPLLAQDFKASEIQSSAVPFIPKPSMATVKANQRAALTLTQSRAEQRKKAKEAKNEVVNPLLAIRPEDISHNNQYFDLRIGTNLKDHGRRPLHFIQRGKFIAKANQMRNEAQMEILKREIAESTAGATGLDVEIVADMLRMNADQVPLADWWDTSFLPSGSLGDFSTGNIDYNQINCFIQRPALIQPPADLNLVVAPKPLALTKAEQKKIRRQRRLEEQQDRQQRIKLGILPPEEPKVKIGNIMKILANSSVQEPSKVEAEVREQVEARKRAHEQANEERKLTAEERAGKTRLKTIEDTSVMVHIAIYCVKRIDRPQLKFKLSINAQQNHLTGCTLMTPTTNLVVVEGGPKGQKHYKNLLLRRINWNEAPEENPETTENEMKVEPSQDNECKLLWEGTATKASWKRFEMKSVHTDFDGREYLTSLGLDHYWNLLKSV